MFRGKVCIEVRVRVCKRIEIKVKSSQRQRDKSLFASVCVCVCVHAHRPHSKYTVQEIIILPASCSLLKYFTQCSQVTSLVMA